MGIRRIMTSLFMFYMDVCFIYNCSLIMDVLIMLYNTLLLLNSYVGGNVVNMIVVWIIFCRFSS